MDQAEPDCIPSTAQDGLELFHPLVREWFTTRVGLPSEPQRRGWPAIAAGQDTLIAAPTGSGKTLAAFLSCLDRLIRRGMQWPMAPSKLEVLYVSPLKALSNDIHRNLESPLAELKELAEQRGTPFGDIRAAVRTGDTPASERQKMVKKPPHILVTTPESLFILLTSERGRDMLASVRTVILDEVHAVARDKRGAHLTLTLARLDHLIAQRGRSLPVRVGLSATQRPINRIARMLVGQHRELPTIVDAGHSRQLDVAIDIIDDELSAVVSHAQFAQVIDKVAELVTQHETTLVFVNTRKLVERVSHMLEERLGEDKVVAHHGSMSRTMRFAAEQRLKTGQVACAVATASLELGIDVGSVDLVVQLGSPRSIATMLQRVGRSGHTLGATPKGRLYAMTRDQLIECAALVRAIKKQLLDEVSLYPAPLDILSQQIVAISASEDIHVDELFRLVQTSAHFADLEREVFDQVLLMLAEGHSDRRGRMGAYLHWDRIHNRVRGRRGARLAAITSGGAIPDNANYAVVQYPEETRVGEIEEDFALESMAGDVFLLGNHPWRIRRVEAGRVLVDDATGLSPTVPFWLGEAPARTPELCSEVSELRREVEQKILAGQSQEEIARWLEESANVPSSAAQQAVAYLAASRAALGVLPTQQCIVAERFFDEAGGTQMIIHSPFGGRVNRAWGLALRKRFCRNFNFELQAAATDDGLILSLGEPHSFPLIEVFDFLRSQSVRTVLTQALLAAPVFEIRWRWNATRALAVLRRNAGKKIAPFLVKTRCQDLLGVIFPMQQACLENVVGDIEIPDHPLVKETVRDCLNEAMDIGALEQLLENIESGGIEIRAADVVEPSLLAHEIVNANPYAYLDEAPLEERRTRAVSLRRGLPPTDANDISALSPEALTQAETEAKPSVRNPDELHDFLLSQWVLPRPSAEGPWILLFEELVTQRRATRLFATSNQGRNELWVAAERLPMAQALYEEISSEVQLLPVLGELPFSVEVPETEVTARKIVGASLEILGPRTARELAEDLFLPSASVEAALAALEADGAIMRGHFRPSSHTPASVIGTNGTDQNAELEWCNRRILARIHRLTISSLRSRIEPVNAAAFMRFLFRWQRVHPQYKLAQSEALPTLIEQLQGFETAAGAWEKEVLPARMVSYQPRWLDELCLTGNLVWCRLSTRQVRPNTDQEPTEEPQPVQRLTPTKAAPLALLLREDADWLRAPRHGENAPDISEHAVLVQDSLANRGASFLGEIATNTELAPAEVENALWELTATGLASADGFASLRVLVDRTPGLTRGHFDEKRQSTTHRRWRAALNRVRNKDQLRPRHAVHSLPSAAGRWSLLPKPDAQHLSTEAHARQLLLRYGVVFRDLLARESCLPPWREILIALRRLEARGEIRGGRFVASFVGEQFALPEAVQELRSVRNPTRVSEWIRIPATDPLNLVGLTSPGPRVPAVIGNAVLYKDGVPFASKEAGDVIVRRELAPGARVDNDLRYHEPPTNVVAQTNLFA